MTTLSLTSYNGSATASTLPADAPMPAFLREVGFTATDLNLESIFEAMTAEYHDDDESIISHILTDINDPCSYMSWSEFYAGSDLGYDDDAEWFHLYARVYGERVTSAPPRLSPSSLPSSLPRSGGHLPLAWSVD